MRKTEFANGEYYHIFNRGVDKRDVFLDNADYNRFIKSIKEFNDIRPSWKVRFEVSPRVTRVTRGETSNFVELVAYCINPNHYHFILKQNIENGITDFMRKIGTGYTMYFNKRYKRSGVLFQGKFKSVHINSNEYLLLLSAYVNANHEIHGYSKNWPYSSLLDYAGERKGELCNKEIILEQFDNNFDEYEKYVKNNTDYFKDKKEDENYILE